MIDTAYRKMMASRRATPTTSRAVFKSTPAGRTMMPSTVPRVVRTTDPSSPAEGFDVLGKIEAVANSNQELLGSVDSRMRSLEEKVLQREAIKFGDTPQTSDENVADIIRDLLSREKILYNELLKEKNKWAPNSQPSLMISELESVGTMNDEGTGSTKFLSTSDMEICLIILSAILGVFLVAMIFFGKIRIV